jgi:hypothetical protein
MAFTIVLIVFIVCGYAMTKRIEALEEAIRELRAKGCLDTTDKHTLTIQEQISKAEHPSRCRKYVFTFGDT